MRIAPVSGDLLVKVVLLAVAGGVVWYASRRAVSAVQGAVGQASDAVWAPVQDFGRWANDTWSAGTGYVADTAGAAWQGAGSAAWALSPTNNDNVIYDAANKAFGVPSIGSANYDFFNPGEFVGPPFVSGGGGVFNGHGATGSW